jgi:antitoxin component YwqK of YwqJK toxin-antitoxin module
MIQNIAIDNVEVKKSYYESGALEREIPYVNGKMQGIVKWYYTSGALLWEIPYVNGNKHGIERGYDNDNSNIHCLSLYDKGQTVAFVKI